VSSASDDASEGGSSAGPVGLQAFEVPEPPFHITERCEGGHGLRAFDVSEDGSPDVQSGSNKLSSSVSSLGTL
jgi:hypothetical protein